MSAPLSTHSVHVPPRQTVHETADLNEEAASIVLTKVAWPGPDTHVKRTAAREALFLSVGDAYALAPGSTSFDVPQAKAFNVTVGNWSDTPMEVTFEIWGKP